MWAVLLTACSHLVSVSVSVVVARGWYTGQVTEVAKAKAASVAAASTRSNISCNSVQYWYSTHVGNSTDELPRLCHGWLHSSQNCSVVVALIPSFLFVLLGERESFDDCDTQLSSVVFSWWRWVNVTCSLSLSERWDHLTVLFPHSEQKRIFLLVLQICVSF